MDPNLVVNEVNGQIKRILESQQLRRKYFMVKSIIIKCEKLKANIWFLNHCLMENVIPNTFKTSVNKQNISILREQQWNSIEFRTSCKFINIAKTELHVKLKMRRAELDLSKSEFYNLLNEKNLDTFAIKDKFKASFRKFSISAYDKNMARQNDRLAWLVHKQQEHNFTRETNNKQSNRRFIKRTKYRKIQKKKHGTPFNLFKNFTSMNFDDNTKNLIEKGGSFVPMSKTVNKTEIAAACSRLHRKMCWKEYMHKQDDSDEEYIPPLFPKPPKTNLPPGPTPKPLLDCITGIRTEILSSQLNKVQNNFSCKDKEALQNLINLQKSGEIVIQPCDKTGGFGIMNRGDYVNSFNEQLSAEHSDNNGNITPYYAPIDPEQINENKKIILEAVEEGHELNILSEEEYEALSDIEAKPGRLYGLPKDHKNYEVIPPLRPIVSSCGTVTEKIAKYVDHHSNYLVKKLDSYVEDSPHFLRQIEDLKRETIPDNVIPVTIDVTSLYTNIPIPEGIETFKNTLEQREDKSIPTWFLIKLLTMILTMNIFVFNGLYYLQRIGTAMGSKVAPTFANIFMGNLETQILRNCGKFKGMIYKQFWRRYIDDIFILWQGTEEELKEFLNYINSFHHSIKFTADYDFGTRTISYLDIKVTIENGTINTDLHQKDTHVTQYLLPSSSHPPHICKNIPYSLGYRLLRICSQKDTFEKRLVELKNCLLTRKYSHRIIDNAFSKLRSISRTEALEKVYKEKNDKITFVFPFEPRLPSISKTINRHIKFMSDSDSHLKEVFKDGSQVAYKRSKNLRELLCRAKLFPTFRRTSNRQQTGWFTCGKACTVCCHSNNTKEIKSTSTGEIFPIQQMINCKSKNLIYVIHCSKCAMQYVGKTSQTFAKRMLAHRDSIRNADTTIGKHFSSNGHKSSDMRFYGIELVTGDNFTLQQREQLWIGKLNTIHDGLNTYRA